MTCWRLDFTLKKTHACSQSVVSAIAEPDTVVVRYRPWKRRRWEGSDAEVWTIGEKKSGSKKKKVVMDKGQLNDGFIRNCHHHMFFLSSPRFPQLYFFPDTFSTVEKSLPSSPSSSSLCLPEETFVAIARLAVELEKGFGGPRDVEFAVMNEKVYLLQVTFKKHLVVDMKIYTTVDSPSPISASSPRLVPSPRSTRGRTTSCSTSWTTHSAPPPTSSTPRPTWGEGNWSPLSFLTQMC